MGFEPISGCIQIPIRTQFLFSRSHSLLLVFFSENRCIGLASFQKLLQKNPFSQNLGGQEFPAGRVPPCLDGLRRNAVNQQVGLDFLCSSFSLSQFISHELTTVKESECSEPRFTLVTVIVKS